jgi:hypothetical protein
MIQMTLESIEEYDSEAALKDSRSDFLSYLQQQHEKSKDSMTQRDMVNHLMSNL